MVAPAPPPPPPPVSNPPNLTSIQQTYVAATSSSDQAAKIAAKCAEPCEILDLSNCEMNSIPMAMYLLTRSYSEMVLEVNLSGNQLKSINFQKFFDTYKNLKVIDLSGNPLTKRQIETIESHNLGVAAVENMIVEDENDESVKQQACLCKIKF